MGIKTKKIESKNTNNYVYLANAINDIENYCIGLFNKLSNNSSEYIDSIKFALNNDTEIMKKFNNELDKICIAKYNKKLVYCNFMAEIDKDIFKLIAVFGYDYNNISENYIITNAVSIEKAVDELLELANKIGNTCNCI